MPWPPAPFRQAGFTYFGVLAAIALLGAVLGSTVEVWHTAVVREKEQQLLFVGRQYRQAIERYYRNTPGTKKLLPPSLEDLLEDPRLPGTQRYLRRLYRDPVTGLAEWALLKDADGGILGLHSLSEARPRKSAGFGPGDARFAGAERYAEWVFEYRPDRPASAGKTGLQQQSLDQDMGE
jgi:type II secretory pathway pseudopilin PulG